MSENDETMKIDDGGAAFPVREITINFSSLDGRIIGSGSPGMTLRAYAAIKLRVPASGIDWLDAMIVKAKRDELAGMAMQGEIANGGFYIEAHMGKLSEDAYAQADAMLAERKRGACKAMDRHNGEDKAK